MGPTGAPRGLTWSDSLLCRASQPSVVRRDCLVALVKQMLELHKRQAAAKPQSDPDLYQRQTARPVL